MCSSSVLLLPAAGFGTRVQSPTSKEMLPSPTTQKPLIDFWLMLGKKLSLPIHVITRAEKENLLHYLDQWQKIHHYPISIQCINPSGEWPNTLLSAQPYWRKFNLVGLPDTTFAPLQVAQDLLNLLLKSQAAAALFKSAQVRHWGLLNSTNLTIQGVEKPQTAEIIGPSDQPWGLLAFQYDLGQTWLTALEKSSQDHQRYHIEQSIQYRNLDHFEDKTRGP